MTAAMRLPSIPRPPAPSPEDRFILALVGTAQRRRAERDRARDLAAQVDRGRLTARLRELRVLGVVGPRATALLPVADRTAFEQDVSASVDGHRRQARVHATMLRSIREALAAAGIDAIALKGPDLAVRIHGDLGARPSADLDLLARARQMNDSIEVLGRLGYATDPSDNVPWRLTIHHELQHPSPAMPPVEIHWRVERYCGSPFSDGVVGRALLDESGTRRPQPVDELAMLLMVAAKDGLAGLRMMADIAAWWDRYGPDVANGGLGQLATRHPTLARPLATAGVIAERLVGLPAAQLLGADCASQRRSRLAVRLADPLMAIGGAQRVLVEGLLSDGPALRRWLRHRVMPSQGHVATIYSLDPDERLRIALMAAAHPARLAARSVWPLVGACQSERLRLSSLDARAHATRPAAPPRR